MVDVSSLSDDELRTKLVEYGFPVMPITGTTRNLMAKKLKLLMETKAKPSSGRMSLGKFSSDEESDADVAAIKKDKNRRITMAVPPMQQSKGTINVEEKKDMEPPAPVQKEKKKSSRSAKIIVEVKQSPDTASDSEPEVVETEYKKSYEIEVPMKKKSSPKKDSSPAPVARPQETVSSRSTISSSSLRRTIYTLPSENSNKLEQMRARLSLEPRKDYFAESALSSPDKNDEDAPFLSNFTRRLSQMSPRNGLNEGRDYEDAGSSLYSRTNYSTRPRAREFSKASYVSSTESEPSKPAKSSSSNVSFILVGVVVLFFIVLAALYYGMHSGAKIDAIMGKTSKYEPQDD